jgi:hypothetical protein
MKAAKHHVMFLLVTGVTCNKAFYTNILIFRCTAMNDLQSAEAPVFFFLFILDFPHFAFLPLEQ